MSNVTELNPRKIKGYECKHAVYRKSAMNPNNDLLMVKEIIHYEDGGTKPVIREYYNFEREFWITKVGFQKHEDKKEWESQSKLTKFKSTQARLIPNIAKAMGRPGMQGSLRTIARSQYLYGCDVTTPVLIKQKYMKTFPTCITENTVAVLDIETNVHSKEQEILMVALTLKDKAYISVTEAYLGSLVDVDKRINDLLNEHLGDMTMPDPKNKGKEINVNLIADRGIKLQIEVVKSPGAAAAAAIKKAHEWMPDIIAVWNVDFDLTKMMDALEKEGYDLGEVFSDPKIPKEYRTARYIRGPAQRVTANGKVLSLHMAERWHTLDSLSSFYFFCAMATYRKLRVAKGNEPNYKLDSILNKHLGIRKLKFDDLLEKRYPGVVGGSLKWHQIMQKEFKLEYMIYCLFDCISVELLDEKTGDLGKAISALTGVSEYAKFPSQPRRLVDNMHFTCLDKGEVIGTTSDQMVDDNDAHVVSVNDWIVTLSSNMVADNGIVAIRDLPKLTSYVRIHIADLDCVSTYPSTGVAMNISRETTYRELARFKDIPEVVQREISVNFTGGVVNAYEIGKQIYNFPTHEKLLTGFNEFIESKKAA